MGNRYGGGTRKKWIFTIKYVAAEYSMSFSRVARREIETSLTCLFFSVYAMYCVVLTIDYENSIGGMEWSPTAPAKGVNMI